MRLLRRLGRSRLALLALALSPFLASMSCVYSDGYCCDGGYHRAAHAAHAVASFFDALYGCW